MLRLWLVSPLGLLFAWSGPWTCEKYTAPDGGTSVFNPNIPVPDGGGQSGTPTTQTSSTAIDGGVSGVGLFVVVNADGGGVTLGPVANFHSNFAWIANNDGTVSLIDTDAEKEIGNYPAAIPVDMAGQNFCASNPPSYGGHIKPAMSCMLHNRWQESTSRTVVDLNGGVFAANRAWNGGCEVSGDQMDQPSVTHINNAIDHLSDPNYPLASCDVRCPARNGGAALTSSQFPGAPTLAPYSSFYNSNPSYWCPDPTGTLSAQGSKPPITYSGTQYVDPTDFCNPVNYDDCVMYTIPIGAHNGYNQYGINTQGSYLARGEVIAPNCDPLTRECDIWVGLSWGGLAVRLSGRRPSQCAVADSHGSCWNPPGWSASSTFYPHMPTAVVPFATDSDGSQISIGSSWGGATPYGAVVDCRGYLWGNNPGSDPDPPAGNGHMLFGIDTNAIDFKGHPTSPPLTQFSIETPNSSYLCGQDGQTCNGLPTPTNTTGECGSYGIAVDVQGRVWLSRYAQGGGACDFDPGKWLTQIGGVANLGSLSYPDYSAAISAFHYPVTWTSYNMDGDLNGGWASVGIVSDKYGNVYPTTFGTYSGAMGFVPDTGTVDGQGNETGFTVLFPAHPTGPGSNTHGIDAALDISLPGGMALWGTDDTGDAVRFDPATGNLLTDIHVNHGGFYTYSDFTGYALRNITSPKGQYTQVFQGMNSAPEFTAWQSVSFSASIPPAPQSPPTTGDDLIIAVRAGNSIPQLAAATDIQVCDVGAGCAGVTCTGGSNCSGTVDISSLNLQGEYLAVDFLLETPGCSGSGMNPVLYTASATSTGPGN